MKVCQVWWPVLLKLRNGQNIILPIHFISKQRTKVRINISKEIDLDEISDDLEDIDRLVGNLQLNNKERDEWFGMTWGMKIRDNFSIGVSSFVSDL